MRVASKQDKIFVHSLDVVPVVRPDGAFYVGVVTEQRHVFLLGGRWGRKLGEIMDDAVFDDVSQCQ